GTRACPSYDWAMSGRLGACARGDGGQATAIYRKEGGQWRLVHAHVSPVPPALAGEPAGGAASPGATGIGEPSGPAPARGTGPAEKPGASGVGKPEPAAGKPAAAGREKPGAVPSAAPSAGPAPGRA